MDGVETALWVVEARRARALGGTCLCEERHPARSREPQQRAYWFDKIRACGWRYTFRLFHNGKGNSSIIIVPQAGLRYKKNDLSHVSGLERRKSRCGESKFIAVVQVRKVSGCGR